MLKLAMCCVGILILLMLVVIPCTEVMLARSLGTGLLVAVAGSLGMGLILWSIIPAADSLGELLEKEEAIRLKGSIAWTKDGVPVVWGMKIYDENLEGGVVIAVLRGRAIVRLLSERTLTWICKDCYSTKAANEESDRRERERVDSG